MERWWCGVRTAKLAVRTGVTHYATTPRLWNAGWASNSACIEAVRQMERLLRRAGAWAVALWCWHDTPLSKLQMRRGGV